MNFHDPLCDLSCFESCAVVSLGTLDLFRKPVYLSFEEQKETKYTNLLIIGLTKRGY